MRVLPIMKKRWHLLRLPGIPIACRSFYTNDTKVCNLQHCWTVKNGKMAANLMATSPDITCCPIWHYHIDSHSQWTILDALLKWFYARIINIFRSTNSSHLPLLISESHLTNSTFENIMNNLYLHLNRCTPSHIKTGHKSNEDSNNEVQTDNK